jgi:hypothetical protein
VGSGFFGCSGKGLSVSLSGMRCRSWEYSYVRAGWGRIYSWEPCGSVFVQGADRLFKWFKMAKRKIIMGFSSGE